MKPLSEFETTIKSHLESHHLAAFATIKPDHTPSVSMVGYSTGVGLGIIIATYTASRKHVSLAHDAHVALAIGWEQGKTLQYEGKAKRVSTHDIDAVAKRHYARIPTLAKFLPTDQQVFYTITPTWVRLTDFTRNPWEMIEEVYE